MREFSSASTAVTEAAEGSENAVISLVLESTGIWVSSSAWMRDKWVQVGGSLRGLGSCSVREEAVQV